MKFCVGKSLRTLKVAGARPVEAWRTSLLVSDEHGLMKDRYVSFSTKDAYLIHKRSTNREYPITEMFTYLLWPDVTPSLTILPKVARAILWLRENTQAKVHRYDNLILIEPTTPEDDLILKLKFGSGLMTCDGLKKVEVNLS